MDVNHKNEKISPNKSDLMRTSFSQDEFEYSFGEEENELDDSMFGQKKEKVDLISLKSKKIKKN